MSESTAAAGSVGESDRIPLTSTPDEVLAALGTDAVLGLDPAEAAARLSADGPNALPPPPRSSVWALAGSVLRSPMIIMQFAVVAAALVLGNAPLAIALLLLVGLNLTLAIRQELGARRTVDALSAQQLQTTRVVRGGETLLLDARELVRGDLVLLEAGDGVPADARVIVSASLEVQEAALTGESLPVAKGAAPLDDPSAALAERSNVLHSGTDVVRGTTRAVITATGTETEIGSIAGMLDRVQRAASPLQRELTRLTTVVGIVAWIAVAIIVVIGIARGMDLSALLLLAITVAISAIPAGLPTFVQVILATAASRLAAQRAVIKDLGDVETLGATSSIVTDKTGTLTRNEMMVSALVEAGHRYSVEGDGYARVGRVLAPAGVDVPDFTPLAYALCLVSDATVSSDGAVVGDPTEAAMVVLAGKLGVDETLTRAEYPRLAEVPFDSDYKFMATWHRVPFQGRERLVQLVKGAPDVILERASTVLGADGALEPIDDHLDALTRFNTELASDGLRVLAFALRLAGDDDLDAVLADPFAQVQQLVHVALIGMIDPLRPAAIEAVSDAHAAGIDVRMITGDHVVTASAIGRDLGLIGADDRGGALTGAEFAALSDSELQTRLDGIHVIGRVTPDDKLRLVQALQARGEVVAMTGDAINDAAGIKAADVGVAMGSGSEVTKQAARVVLADDDFRALIGGIRIGRETYDRLVGYVGFQMTALIALVVLYLIGSIGNIAGGVIMPPFMVLVLSFGFGVFPVLTILNDRAAVDVMTRAPRDPSVPLASVSRVWTWALYGAVLVGVTLVPLLAGPDIPSATQPTASVTMAFATQAIAYTLVGLSMRRERESAFAAPFGRPLLFALIPAVALLLITELPVLQRAVDAVALTPMQWLQCLLLAAVLPAVVEVVKAVRRRAMAPR
jgi:Ca2+-transporting ATPase